LPSGGGSHFRLRHTLAVPGVTARSSTPCVVQTVNQTLKLGGDFAQGSDLVENSATILEVVTGDLFKGAGRGHKIIAQTT